MTIKGRFAPSPSGRMHLGNLFSALIAWLDVRAAGGTLVLRMEDLDPDRCRPVFAEQVADDLRWLGLDWDEGYQKGGPFGPYLQSERTAFYAEQFARLDAQNRLYPCFCTRADRLAAAAPHPGEEEKGPKPCPCKGLSKREQAERALTRTPAWKISVSNETVFFTDDLFGPQSQNLPRDCGDFILRRADGVYAYQLAVTTDDGAMGVNRVVRGRDLLDSTPRQLWLLGLMGYPAPIYLHLPLLTAPDGRRLSKREKDLDMGALRARFTAPQLVANLANLAEICVDETKIAASELVNLYVSGKLSRDDKVIKKTN